MSQYLTHRTLAGDRWDLLALRYYGDPCLMNVLLQANPDQAPLPLLPAGLTLTVPVLEAVDLAPLTGSTSEGDVPWL